MPLWLLYAFSDLISFSAGSIFRYRRSVVYENLHRAFPEKDNREIRKIASGFYRHFSDLIVETIKVMDFSKEELADRIRFRNTDLIERYFKEGKAVVAVAAHFGNWEWLQGLARTIPHQSIAVYKPLNNKEMEKVLTRQREKSGAEIVSMRDIIRSLRRYKRQNKPTFQCIFPISRRYGKKFNIGQHS